MRVTFLADTETATLKDFAAHGLNKDEHKSGPLEGHSVIYEDVSGNWKATLEGGNAPSKDQREMLEKPFVTIVDLYPSRKVKLGESWSIEGEELRKFISGYLLGYNILFLKGECRMSFDKTYEHKGEKCVEISVVLQAEGTTEGTEMGLAPGPVPVRFDLTGTIVRSLSRLYELEVDFSGKISFEGQVATGYGERCKFDMIASGQTRMRESQRISNVDNDAAVSSEP